MKITLTVNGVVHRVEAPPLRRLLDLLREDLGLTGTKEGCGEGECGACAVFLDGRLINSCLVPALQVNGRIVQTIEGFGTPDAPDPLQRIFLEEGAVQCGFCTPGMVLAARNLLNQNPNPTRIEIRAALSGTLCRCTGYDKIVRAVERAAVEGAVGATTVLATTRTAVALSEALSVLADHGSEVTVISGATDLLAAIHAGAPSPSTILDVSAVAELNGIVRVGASLEIRGCTTLSAIAANPEIGRFLPVLRDAARLFGAPAIQERATLAGNLMTASPAADLPPPLLALEAAVVLIGSPGTREVPLSEFYSGYRTTVRRPDELLQSVRIPIPAAGTHQAFFKVGTRRAQSIAKVSLAVVVQMGPDGKITRARIAAGSVAATPILLRRTQSLLENRVLTRELAEEAGARAAAEVQPIDDVRSTAEYRRTVIRRLTTRFLCAIPK
jgi:xanthine dehydrogenase iron-sulfur cluster and FAD-binding subunit A